MRTAEEILKMMNTENAKEDQFFESFCPNIFKDMINDWYEVCNKQDKDGSSFTKDDIKLCYYYDIIVPMGWIHIFHDLIFDRESVMNHFKDISVDLNIVSANDAYNVLSLMPADFRNTLLSLVDKPLAFEQSIVNKDLKTFSTLCLEHNSSISDLLKVCQRLQSDFDIKTLMDYAQENDQDGVVEEALEKYAQPIMNWLKRKDLKMDFLENEDVFWGAYFALFDSMGTYSTREQNKLNRLIEKAENYYSDLHEYYYGLGYIHYLAKTKKVDIAQQLPEWIEQNGEEDDLVKYAKLYLEKEDKTQTIETETKTKALGRKNGSWLRNIEDCPEESIGVKIEEIIWPDLKKELEKIHYGSIAGKSRETAIATLGASLLYYAYLEMKWAKDFNEAGVQISFWRTIKFLNVSRNNLKEYIKMMLAYDKIKALIIENGSVGFSIIEFCKKEGVDDIRAKLLTRNDGKNMAIINDIVNKLKTKLTLTLVDA